MMYFIWFISFPLVNKYLKNEILDSIIKQLSTELTAVVMNEVNIADNINLSDQQIIDCITKQEYKPKVKPPQIDIDYIKTIFSK